MIPWVSLAVWLPAAAALVISFLPRHWVRAIQALPLLATGASLGICIGLFLELRTLELSHYHLVERLAWYPPLGIQYKVGVDGLSLGMLLLTGLVSWAAVWMSLSISKRQKEFFVLALVAITGVYGLFAAIDLFFFVIFYELASIPMYFLVGIWGSDKLGSGRPIYKETAATKLLLYLQLGGGIVLLGILALYFVSGVNSFDYQALRGVTLAPHHQKLLFVLFFIGFGIEAGLVPLHTWLPEGHSSAPTPLSMLLAGVLLKMGGYGILRLGVQLLPEGADSLFPVVGLLGAVNVLYGALCALRQSDVKVMIAYSSVSHMGMFFMGLNCVRSQAPYAQYGLTGAYFQLFSHGLITALLFAVAGAVYNQTHSRDIRAWGGLAGRVPRFTFFYVLAAMGSLGLPGMTGFCAEFMVFLGTMGTLWWLAVLAVPGMLITTLFLLRSVQYGFFGPLNPDHLNIRDTSVDEFIPFALLAGAILLFGFMPRLLTDTCLTTLNAMTGMLG